MKLLDDKIKEAKERTNKPDASSPDIQRLIIGCHGDIEKTIELIKEWDK